MSTLIIIKGDTDSRSMYGDHYDGDILMMEHPNSDFKPKPWPNKIIPYKIFRGHTTRERDLIVSSLRTIESLTCVKFVERRSERDYVEVKVIECSTMFRNNLIIVFFYFMYKE